MTSISRFFLLKQVPPAERVASIEITIGIAIEMGIKQNDFDPDSDLDKVKLNKTDRLPVSSNISPHDPSSPSRDQFLRIHFWEENQQIPLSVAFYTAQYAQQQIP